MPGAFADEVARLKKTGLGVRLRSAPLSMRDLNVVRQRLTHKLTGWTSIMTKPHGLGITVTAPDALVSAIENSDAIRDVRAFVEEAAATPGASVDVVAGGSMIFISREHDIAPHWGGAQTGPGTGSTACTAGFSTGSLVGRSFLTTFHCYPSGGANVTDGTGVPIGKSWFGVNAQMFDLARIDLNATNEGRIYDGPIGQPFVRNVKGHGGSYVGMLICTSGGQSGAVCDIEVDATNNIITELFTAQLVTDLISAHRIDGTSAVGSGDSGGPVFSLQVDLVGIKARGILVAVDGSGRGSCTGVPGRTVCSSKFMFADIRNALSMNDVWLELR